MASPLEWALDNSPACAESRLITVTGQALPRMHIECVLVVPTQGATLTIAVGRAVLTATYMRDCSSILYAHSRGNTDNCRGPFASLLQVLKPTRCPTQETTLSVVWRPSRYALVFTVFIWTVSSFVFHLSDNTVNCRGTFLFDII